MENTCTREDRGCVTGTGKKNKKNEKRGGKRKRGGEREGERGEARRVEVGERMKETVEINS